ncbi:hypothetical protein [Stutzerimonas kunmingensis]|uniref:Uncharacterized protein n=1 Tax=Stutzerimonas kunmingensis TaxID=1211807 RepID=A0A9X1SNN8_9GAMM|nr:hypothetical protein [Stutzerimonas kunmingensis]MCD1607689.1 hypothetical protein [Stutzerimonas kunmingensis]PNG01438.1 hypothetical protein CXK98_05830 [Stutzerimonas kunmingensis]
MNVRELIEVLSKQDPEAKVLVEYDTHFYNVRGVDSHEILTQGVSWADYPSANVLDRDEGRYPLPEDERAINERSPREIAIVISGSPV